MPRAACRTAIVATGTGASLEPALSVAHDADADHITLAVDGLDDVRRARVIAQDLPQAADAHVDAAVEGIGVAAAQQLGQLRAAEHAVGRAEQHREQPVLRAAQVDVDDQQVRTVVHCNQLLGQLRSPRCKGPEWKRSMRSAVVTNSASRAASSMRRACHCAGATPRAQPVYTSKCRASEAPSSWYSRA